jgi:hypothetical protein
MPRKTPVWLPANWSGAWPAASSASQLTSSTKPLLRVHAGRFARRNAKKLRVELVDAFQETAIPRHRQIRVR